LENDGISENYKGEILEKIGKVKKFAGKKKSDINPHKGVIAKCFISSHRTLEPK
jgi:hypothetical protein